MVDQVNYFDYVRNMIRQIDLVDFCEQETSTFVDIHLLESALISPLSSIPNERFSKFTKVKQYQSLISIFYTRDF